MTTLSLGIEEIWNILTVGDDVERRPVALMLHQLDGPTKRYLTERTLEALERECRPDAPGGDHNAELRGWLLTTLVRLATPDNPLAVQARERAAAAVERAVEPVSWARYWVLESFYQVGDPEIEQFAIRALADPVRADDDGKADYVVAIATAILALKRPDSEYAETIGRNLAPPDTNAVFTRPFRTIFSPVFAADLVSVIEAGSYCDAMFDAIGQISLMPRNHPARERAASALAALIKRRRRHSFWDQARTSAINALARVGTEESVITIAPDLCDDNPAIVRAAARAISDIRGCDSVQFIAEQAQRGVASRPVRRETIVRQYADALRCLHEHRGDDTVIAQLSELLSAGREEDRSIANDLLMNLGGAKAYEKLRDKERFIESLVRADEHVQKQIEVVVERAQDGLVLSRYLDIGIFVMGMVLVVAVAATAIINSNGDPMVLAGAVGGGGALAALLSAWLVASRARILSATQWLVHIHAAFMGYTRQLQQADQAFARRLGAGGPLTGQELADFGQLVDRSMASMLPRLNRPPTRSWFHRQDAAPAPKSSAGYDDEAALRRTETPRRRGVDPQSVELKEGASRNGAATPPP